LGRCNVKRSGDVAAAGEPEMSEERNADAGRSVGWGGRFGCVTELMERVKDDMVQIAWLDRASRSGIVSFLCSQAESTENRMVS
jgi:hypothetical protein